MKLRSYTLLFKLFSFLSDKTNGASFFVKYKLLLGTLIMGLVSTSACKSKKEAMCYVQIEEKPLREVVTCYDSIIVKQNLDTINVRGTIIDKSGEPIADVSVVIKNSINGVLTDRKGKFALKALPTDSLRFSLIGYVSQVISVGELEKNDTIIMEKSDIELSCYIVTVAEPKR